MNVKYIVEEDDQEIEDAFEFETNFDKSTLGWIVEEVAEDYNRDHDGWEASWPLTFTLFINGRSLGSFKVDREFEPTFMIISSEPPAAATDEMRWRE